MRFSLILSFLLFGSLFLCAGHSFAQPADTPDQVLTPDLKGSHSLSLGLGLLSNAQVNPGSVSANGFLGSFSYMYFPHSEWALETSVSLHDSELSGGNAASVTSLLFGASYYPEALMPGTVVRPYLSGAIGPYIASQTGSSLGNTGAETQTVIGARLGGGIDAFAFQWLRLGLRAAYHLTPEYEDALESIQNPTGLQLSLEIGVSFGGR